MRELVILPKAERTIDLVGLFIESQNLPGSSAKWLNEIFIYLYEYTALKIDFPLCKNQKLAKRKLSCVTFKKKWVIAFTYTNTAFTVHQIIYGSKLK